MSGIFNSLKNVLAGGGSKKSSLNVPNNLNEQKSPNSGASPASPQPNSPPPSSNAASHAIHLVGSPPPGGSAQASPPSPIPTISVQQSNSVSPHPHPHDRQAAPTAQPLPTARRTNSTSLNQSSTSQLRQPSPSSSNSASAVSSLSTPSNNRELMVSPGSSSSSTIHLHPPHSPSNQQYSHHPGQPSPSPTPISTFTHNNPSSLHGSLKSPLQVPPHNRTVSSPVDHSASASSSPRAPPSGQQTPNSQLKQTTNNTPPSTQIQPRRAVSDPVATVMSGLNSLGQAIGLGHLPDNLTSCRLPTSGGGASHPSDSSDDDSELDDPPQYIGSDEEREAQQRELASRIGSDVGIHKVPKTDGTGTSATPARPPPTTSLTQGLSHLLPPPPQTTKPASTSSSGHRHHNPVSNFLRKTKAHVSEFVLHSTAGHTMPAPMRTAMEKDLIKYKNEQHQLRQQAVELILSDPNASSSSIIAPSNPTPLQRSTTQPPGGPSPSLTTPNSPMLPSHTSSSSKGSTNWSTLKSLFSPITHSTTPTAASSSTTTAATSTGLSSSHSLNSFPSSTAVASASQLAALSQLPPPALHSSGDSSSPPDISPVAPFSAPVSARREGECDCNATSPSHVHNNNCCRAQGQSGTSLSPNSAATAAAIAAEDGHWSSQYSAKKIRKVSKKPSISHAHVDPFPSVIPSSGSATPPKSSPSQNGLVGPAANLPASLALGGEWKRIDQDITPDRLAVEVGLSKLEAVRATTMPVVASSTTTTPTNQQTNITTPSSSTSNSISPSPLVWDDSTQTKVKYNIGDGELEGNLAISSGRFTCYGLDQDIPVFDFPANRALLSSFVFKVPPNKRPELFFKHVDVDGVTEGKIYFSDGRSYRGLQAYQKQLVTKFEEQSQPKETNDLLPETRSRPGSATSLPPVPTTVAGRTKHSSSHSHSSHGGGGSARRHNNSHSSRHENNVEEEDEDNTTVGDNPDLPSIPSSRRVPLSHHTSSTTSSDDADEDEEDQVPARTTLRRGVTSQAAHHHHHHGHHHGHGDIREISDVSELDDDVDPLYVSQREVLAILKQYKLKSYQKKLTHSHTLNLSAASRSDRRQNTHEEMKESLQGHYPNPHGFSAHPTPSSSHSFVRSKSNKKREKSNSTAITPASAATNDPYHDWNVHDDSIQRQPSLSTSVISSSPAPTALTPSPSISALIQTNPSTTSTSLINSSTASTSSTSAHHHLQIIDLKDITDRRQLSEGHDGVAFLGRYEQQDVVVKEPKKKIIGSEEWTELQLHMSVPPHTNIVHFIGICMLQTQVYFVTKFIERGSLKGLLSTPTEIGGDQIRAYYRNPLQLIKAACDIAAGLEHLHSVHIVHRDVAARNILVAADGTHVVSDFGLSRRMSEEKMITPPTSKDGLAQEHFSDVYTMTHEKPTALPARWTAPEALLSQQFTAASDVYSLGVCMFEMLTGGAYPYANVRENSQVIIGLVKGDLNLEFPADASPVVVSFIKHAMEPIATRPSMHELKMAMESWLQQELIQQQQALQLAAAQQQQQQQPSSDQPKQFLTAPSVKIDEILASP